MNIKIILAFLCLFSLHCVSYAQVTLSEDSWKKDKVKIEEQIIKIEKDYRNKTFHPDASKKLSSSSLHTPHSLFMPFDYSPQSLFLIKYKGKTFFGKKYISDLVIHDGLPGLFCSNISQDMILGTFEKEQITQDGILIFYTPISEAAKSELFCALTQDRSIDITYPYVQLLSSQKLEKTTPTEGWTVDEDRAEFLSLGEREIRAYTIDFLKTFGNLDGKKIFDPACSTGKFLQNIKAAFPRVHTIGQELSQQMVEYAKDKVDEIYFGDSINSQIPDEEVDYIFFRFLNAEVVSTSYAYDLFNAISKKCKKGGYVIIFGHTPVLVACEALEKGGFEVLQRNGLTSDKKHVFQYYVLKKTDHISDIPSPLQKDYSL